MFNILLQCNKKLNNFFLTYGTKVFTARCSRCKSSVTTHQAGQWVHSDSQKTRPFNGNTYKLLLVIIIIIKLLLLSFKMLEQDQIKSIINVYYSKK